MRLAVFVVLLGLAACNRAADTYDPGVEMNFMRACEAQSTIPGMCACTWDKIEAEIEPNDLDALELLPGPEREAHPLTAQINGYAFACGTQLREQTPAP